MTRLEYVLLGWPDAGPRLRLDWRRFAYAGKFVTSNTGKAVAREVGAASEADGAAANEDDDAGVAGGDSAGVDGPDVPPVATDVVAAVAFNEDRTDPTRLWCRYVTVRDDRRGEGVGPRLLAFLVAHARDRGYETVRIAVNNPFAYEAAHRAGFGFTGEETGVAELVCAWPADGDPDRYRAGLDRFRERDLDDAEEAFLRSRVGADPPPRVPTPDAGSAGVDASRDGDG